VSEGCKSRLSERVASELDALRERSQFRTLENPAGINLYSNDYLGLAHDPRLKQAALDALAAASNVGATGSRLLSGNAPEWESLEAEFAQSIGTDAALYFGSGYTANVGLISALAGRGDLIFSDALNHASLIDGIRLSGAEKVIYPHADCEFLERELRKHAAHPGAKLIVTESVFSMDGDIAPLARLADLAKAQGASLIVDEAHAVGVFGPQGRGVCASLGLKNQVFATIHTCGKALASAGAFVCGSGELRDFLINRARTFIFSTAMPPHFAGQIRVVIELARAADDRRAHLAAIAGQLRTRLAAAGVSTGASASQIVPLCLGSNDAALKIAGQLEAAGFAVRAIRPPTVPEGTSRIRLSLTSAISAEEIARLADAIIVALNSSPAAARIPVHA
jgi:8-amino-7-oxononanoate synthase